MPLRKSPPKEAAFLRPSPVPPTTRVISPVRLKPSLGRSSPTTEIPDMTALPCGSSQTHPGEAMLSGAVTTSVPQDSVVRMSLLVNGSCVTTVGERALKTGSSCRVGRIPVGPDCDRRRSDRDRRGRPAFFPRTGGSIVPVGAIAEVHNCALFRLGLDCMSISTQK